jgi:hypothetical protein
MSVVKPSAAIEQRWRGALEASVQQAPLELFLRSRLLEVSSAGASRHSDNVTTATLYFLQAGIDSYRCATKRTLHAAHYPVLGRAACLLSKSLADVIAQPACWRVAALRSIAQLLTPWMGLNDAAYTSAQMCRELDASLNSLELVDQFLCHDAGTALSLNDQTFVQNVSSQLAARFGLISPNNVVEIRTRFRGVVAQR